MIVFFLAVAFLLSSEWAISAPGSGLADMVKKFTETLVGSLEEEPKPTKEQQQDPVQTARIAQEKQQREQILDSTVSQLRSLEGALRRGDLQTAKQVVSRFPSYPPVGNEPKEWNEFIADTTSEIEDLNQELDESWFAEVQGIAAAAHKACLTAEKASDLDALLIRVAAIQMNRSRNNTILVQRGLEILNGVVTTSQHWARHLDQRNAGHVTAANDILHQLGNNSRDYPVLSAEEIQSKLIPVAEKISATTAALEVLVRVESPEGLSDALGSWKALLKDPQYSLSDMRSVSSMVLTLERLTKAHANMKTGNATAALELMGTRPFSSGPSSMLPFLNALRIQIIEGVIAAKVAEITGSAPAPAGNPQSPIDTALEHLKEKSDYKSILEILELRNSVEGRSSAIDSAAVGHYLAAQRFENAGDILMAIFEYRAVVSSNHGDLVPQKEAGEALKRLKEQHPEALKDLDGVLQKELHDLRLQLQKTNLRYPSGRLR